MAAIEVIYLVAATLWIVVAVAALCLGCLAMAKFHDRRRRVNRLFDVVCVPIELGRRGVLFLRWCERAGRPYGVTALSEAAVGLHKLIGEFRPGGRVALSSASRRR